MNVSKQVVDSVLDINVPRRKIKPVAGDRLCMVNLLLEALTHVTGNQATRKDVVSQLQRDLVTKFDFHKMFSMSSKDIDILTELDKFLESPLTCYNESTSDLFLAALGNVYKVNIIIFQSDEKRCWICDLSENTNSYSTTLYFSRTLSPHIDPVVKLAEPMEDDDEVTITKIIQGRPLTEAEIKQEPNENDDDGLVIIEEIRGKIKRMKQESLEDEFVSYNGKLLL